MIQTPTLLWNEESCWQAVLERNALGDGQFYYGVRSTGIFCRPTCPSRRPSRKQIQFFFSLEAAHKEGFRPCKRCQPEQKVATHVARIKKACQLIAENSDPPLSLTELGQRVGCSPYHLQRSFKQHLGLSPREYGQALRLERFKTQAQTDKPLVAALYDAGYGSSRALYQTSATQLGMTPATYRRAGQGTLIRFDMVTCALGWLLVATTPKGVCAVSLGDDPGALEADLHQNFAAAVIQRDTTGLQQTLQMVLQTIAGAQPHPTLPLDVQATAFQRRVWQALCAVEQGQTRTYTQIAIAIGQPQAVRAVARACAANPVALLIPCHRILRSDGNLAGYRWGLERKRWLLEKEQPLR